MQVINTIQIACFVVFVFNKFCCVIYLIDLACSGGCYAIRQWWCCYFTHSEGRETSRRPNSRAMPQGLDQKSKMKEDQKRVPKTFSY